MMPAVRLTKRIEFAASHRYARPEWDEAKNRAVFGACYNDPGHGHNYLLEVTISGEVHPDTGMVVNLFDLKQTLLKVLKEFDHYHLNLDTPYFKDLIPTSENLAKVLWTKLESEPDIGTLHAIRLYEDEDLFADITREAGLEVADVTRRYSVNPTPSMTGGPLWDLLVTVHGPIHPETGMVTDIVKLDETVHERIFTKFAKENWVQEFGLSDSSGEALVEGLWGCLEQHIPGGTLQRIRLVQTRDHMFDYSK